MIKYFDILGHQSFSRKHTQKVLAMCIFRWSVNERGILKFLTFAKGW
eukprot:UN19989